MCALRIPTGQSVVPAADRSCCSVPAAVMATKPPITATAAQTEMGVGVLGSTSLRIGVQQDYVQTAHRQLARDVRGERGLADAAFLVEQSEDHGAALRAGKPVFRFCVWCRLVVIHRNGTLLLKVMYLLLGKLRGAKIQCWRGFSDDFVA